MAYTMIDLLDKFIVIEQKGYEMFMKLATNTGVQDKIKVLARVFAYEEQRHLELYKNLKEKTEGESNIEIDFSIYDKASQFIYEFLKYDKAVWAENTREMLESCLNFEKENLALVLSIQGILVKSQEAAGKKNYEVLSSIVQEEQKHIQNIAAFLNRIN